MIPQVPKEEFTDTIKYIKFVNGELERNKVYTIGNVKVEKTRNYSNFEGEITLTSSMVVFVVPGYIDNEDGIDVYNDFVLNGKIEYSNQVYNIKNVSTIKIMGQVTHIEIDLV